MADFIVAIPLFDAEMSVQAYRLCLRSGQKLFDLKTIRDIGDSLLSPGIDSLERFGTEPFAGDKPLLVDINQYQLLLGLPTNLPNIRPERLVVVLDRTIINKDAEIDQAVVARCQSLKKLGYGLALDGYPPDGLAEDILALLDMLVLDYQDPQLRDKIVALNSFLRRGGEMVIMNVPDMEAYQRLKQFPNVLLTGFFYKRPLTVGAKAISPLKVNALQLLRDLNQDDFELTDIAKIIERDPSLSISLLRFINSVGIGVTQEIKSIKNAVAILGQKEIKRWATVAVSLQLASDSPGEIAKLSLERAKFAENLAACYRRPELASSLFMTGLFSLLDIILEMPMAQAVQEIAVDEQIRTALVEKSGPLHEVMALIYAYEHADWDQVSMLMLPQGIELEDVSAAFFDALVWYKQLLDSIAD